MKHHHIHHKLQAQTTKIKSKINNINEIDLYIIK